MKLASKIKLFAMGLAVASATQSISAMPILSMVASESGFNTQGVTQPSDALLLEALEGHDMIAALIGLPVSHADSVEGVSILSENKDLDAMIAAVLGSDGVDADEALSELADADGSIESTQFLGSGGAGGGGGGGNGGIYFGGGNVNLGGPNGSSGHGSHSNKGGSVHPSVVPGNNTPSTDVIVPTIISTDGSAISGDTGATTVPLPTGAWAGLALLGTIGTAYTIRSKRPVVA